MIGRLKAFWSEGRCREDARQFVWFAAGYGAALVLGYLLLREINLALSAKEMGLFSYVMSLAGLSSLVLGLAAPQAYLRFNDAGRHAPCLRRALMPLFSCAACGVAAILWYHLRSPFALLFALVPFFDERVYAFRAQMRPIAANALKTAQLAIPLACVFFARRFAAPENVTAALVFGFYGLGYLAAFLFPLRLDASAEAPNRKTLLTYLAPVMLTMLAGALVYDFTVIMARHLFDYEAAAKMGVAVRGLIFVRALFTVFMMLYPVIYFREMKARRFGVVRAYRLFVIVSAGLFTALLVAFAPFIYRVTGATAYLGSVALFRLLTAAAFSDFLFDVCGLYFQHEIKTWKNTLVKLFSFILLASGVGIVARLRGRADALTLLACAVAAASFCSAALGVVWALFGERCARRAP